MQSSQNSVVEQAADAFWEGNFEAVQGLKCSDCGSNFYFSAYRGKHNFKAEPGRRRQIGLTISCHSCNLRLAHYDGHCPAWLEDEKVENWNEFSELLYKL